jgi:hypothetical protein
MTETWVKIEYDGRGIFEERGILIPMKLLHC